MGEQAGALGGIRRALVVGLGASGLAAVDALARAGVEVVATDDRRDAPGVAVAREAGAEVRLGARPASLLDGVDLLVPSPGVPEHAPVVRAALERGAPVWSEPELGWRLHPRRLVGVTGTNGKTSTTELLTAMLAQAGLKAVACGNIGRPVTREAAASAPDAILVAELSSFQLRFCHRLRPEVGVLLNLAPDHLDWHRSVGAYAAAKARLWQAQQGGDWAVTNVADRRALDLVESAPAGRAGFAGGGGPGMLDRVGSGIGVTVDRGVLLSSVPGRSGPVLEVADLVTDVPHHVANTAAAACAALLVGADLAGVATAAAAFRPGRHRVERVVEHAGVTYVDDSKATNPHAAAAALDAFAPVVWIAGGMAKGVDLGVLGDHLGAVTHAVLLGEAAGELASICARAGVPFEHAGSMPEAVRAAARAARPGHTVLLAPGCASFDLFDGYADRGERFAAAARELAKGRT